MGQGLKIVRAPGLEGLYDGLTRALFEVMMDTRTIAAAETDTVLLKQPKGPALRALRRPLVISSRMEVASSSCLRWHKARPRQKRESS